MGRTKEYVEGYRIDEFVDPIAEPNDKSFPTRKSELDEGKRS